MRITGSQLRQIIRETLEPDDEEDDSYFSSFPAKPEWIPDIPGDVMTTVSSNSITAIKDTSLKCTYDRKPRGLWYAPGTVWLDWIQYEMPTWYADVSYIYTLKLNYSQGGPTAPFGYIGGVLQLQTHKDFMEFSRRFAASEGREINWSAVSGMWDGIEIIPDQRQMANNTSTFWYWGWDIPSGCIWRPSGVADFQLIASKETS